MIDKNVVIRIVDEWLEGKDYFLVYVTISPEEDYELEVGSEGIGQPFKVLRQYQNYIGEEVEVLTNDHKKLVGTLKDANESNFTVTIQKKVKPEGAKRPHMEDEDLTFAYNEIKYTKYVIKFK